MSDLQSRIDYALYMARRDDVLARLARRQGNRAMMALWELYAKQRRAEADTLRHSLTAGARLEVTS